MKKLLTIALHRMLILYGCLLTAIACSSGDDSIADPAETDDVVKMDSVPETAVVDSMLQPQEVDSLSGEVVLDSMSQPQEIDSLPAGGVVDSLQSIVGF